MEFPDFIRAFPALDVPFPDEVVSTNVTHSPAGLTVFFTFHQDVELPPHSHKGQWGIVVDGEVEITMDGTTHVFTTGDSYNIPSGTVHAVKVKAGTKAIDVFEEPDRYPVRA